MKGCNVVGYDKYKESDSFEDCLDSKIAFLALPTICDDHKKEYDNHVLKKYVKN